MDSQEEFYTADVGGTKFTVLKRYQNLISIGAGAQGTVWLPFFYCRKLIYLRRI